MASGLSELPPVVAALTTSIEQNLRKLRHELVRCHDEPKTKRVHAVRTCARRLLAALELTGTLGAPPAARPRRSLRKLLSALSPLRDNQVQLRTLENMNENSGDVPALSVRLEKKTRKLARDATQELATFDPDHFEEDVAKITRKLATEVATGSDGGPAQTAIQGDLASRHLQVARRKRRVTAEDPRSLHRLRLALKSYRYGLAAVAPALPAGGAELSEAVTRLQDQLGAAHDAHVLAKTAAAARKSGQRKAIKRLASALEQASRDAQRAAVEAVNGARLDWPFPSRSGLGLSNV